MMEKRKDIGSELGRGLKELHLPTVRQCYEEAARQAEQESLSYERFLLELVRREREMRRAKRIERYLRESKLPLEKTLETFDLSRLPRKVVQQMRTLLEGHFLDRTECVLAFGNPGTGKTHLLCSIAQQLIRERDRRVLFAPGSLLVQELLVAKRDLKLSRLFKRLAKFDAILIDDIGYVQQSREEMEVLFTLLGERYEKGSVMITSNLPFSKWERIFKDPMTTAAAIDRLIHHSLIIELNIPSYRLEQHKKSTGTQNKKDACSHEMKSSHQARKSGGRKKSTKHRA
jgi:DNA replication protein DnaC